EAAAQIESANGLHAAFWVLELPALIDAGLKYAERVFLRLIRKLPHDLHHAVEIADALDQGVAANLVCGDFRQTVQEDHTCETGRRHPDQSRSLAARPHMPQRKRGD